MLTPFSFSSWFLLESRGVSHHPGIHMLNITHKCTIFELRCNRGGACCTVDEGKAALSLKSVFSRCQFMVSGLRALCVSSTTAPSYPDDDTLDPNLLFSIDRDGTVVVTSRLGFRNVAVRDFLFWRQSFWGGSGRSILDKHSCLSSVARNGAAGSHHRHYIITMITIIRNLVMHRPSVRITATQGTKNELAFRFGQEESHQLEHHSSKS